MINYQEKWFKDDCNNNCAIDFPINENSTVIDLGAYKGIWAKQIINKYNPNIILVEPNYDLCLFLKEEFKNNPKVKIINVGISDETKNTTLYLNNDGSSMYVKTSQALDISCITLDQLLDNLNISHVDLMQINIEGEEYKVLSNMISTESIKRIKNIQIQFHDFIENAVEKRLDIQSGLKSLKFINIYDYPFVFEAWKHNDNM
jgi:FkbM family methyltransferase